MKLPALIFVFILILSANHAIAATGCLRNSNGQLYRSKSGSYYKTNNPVTNPHSKYCIKLSSSSPCYIKSGNNYYPGKLVTYGSPIGCPIDDGVYLLIAMVGIGGYWFLRTKNKAMQARFEIVLKIMEFKPIKTLHKIMILFI